MFRRCLFWMHLACGVAAGLLIFFMSASGVLLTYEKQMIDWRDRANQLVLPDDERLLPVGELALRAGQALPAGTPFSLVVATGASRPVIANAGRERLLLHPASGELLPDAAVGMRAFMSTVKDWHRRLAGDTDSLRANSLDAANLLFVFILVSGMFLWLPPVWRWQLMQLRLLPRTSYASSRMRDYSWHHVFGAWMLLPLLLIAVSGVVFSYPWANQLVFAAYGEAVPERRGPSPAAVPDATVYTVSADGLIELAPVAVAQAPTPGQNARRWLRFIHTGEVYGLAGQTVAGLASLAACLLVCTGLALAWRRLRSSRIRRRRLQQAVLPAADAAC